MTKKERNKWLKQVKGRKIKWYHWGVGEYVVPTGEWVDERSGIFCGIDENWDKDCWWVLNGFKTDKYGAYWELYEDNIDIFLKGE